VIDRQLRTATETVKDGTMSVRDVVAFTGLKRSNVYDLIAQHLLASVRVGGRIVVPRREVVRFLAERLER
jgi:excisionase family DNA binding protein